MVVFLSLFQYFYVLFLWKVFVIVVMFIDQFVVIVGWMIIYLKFYMFIVEYELVFFVYGFVGEKIWWLFRILFSLVVVVNGFNSSFFVEIMLVIMFQFWNLIKYDKLVYVDFRFIFLSNCDFLMEFEFFVVVLDFIFLDIFLLQVMVLQLDNYRFLEFWKSFFNEILEDFLFICFLNEYYSFWYQFFIKYCIEFIFNVQNELERGFKVDGFLKILFLYLIIILLDLNLEIVGIWWKYVCSSLYMRNFGFCISFYDICNFMDYKF